MSYKFKTDGLTDTMRYYGYWNSKDTNTWLTKFSRFGMLDPHSYVQNTREYIFFERPDLHLLSGSALNPELKHESFFVQMYKEDKILLQLLQKSSTSLSSPFIPVLTSSSGLDLPTVSADIEESATNSFGTTINYQRSSEDSDENHEFSLEFGDSRGLEVYKLFRSWDMYERLKDLGLVTPPNINYILNKELHDQVSVYKFIVDMDGETILYYAKMWGVFPKSISREAFSNMDKDGGLNINVSFHAEFINDLDPQIIEDFNHLVSGYISGRKDEEMYNQKLKIINNGPVSCPYVQRVGTGFKLKWKK